MGEIIEFPSNGSTGRGYIAYPSNGPHSTPGIIVIQEWWGLVDQIKRTCDRFAAAGFTALAPDLYQGTTVPLNEPDEAGARMMAINMESAAKELSGAVDELVRRTGRPQVGVIGFCMGGGFALLTANQGFDASAPNYGQVPRRAEQALAGACPIVASYGGRDRTLKGAATKLEDAEGSPSRRGASLGRRDQRGGTIFQD